MSETDTPIVIGALAAGEPVELELPQAARPTKPTVTIPVMATDAGFRIAGPPLADGELFADEQTIALA
ncbi:MAG: hypothetical protein WCB51_09945 [Candidatus Dormiibacterota bacterium]